jgi:two-component system response regulator NreC
MTNPAAELPIRIVLADDHCVVRQGVRSLLEHEGFVIVAEAADGAEAVELVAKHRPDVVVLDFGMPKMNGIDAARAIASRSPSTRTVLLTLHTEDLHVLGALKAGIHGYVVKAQPVEDVVSAIRAVHMGSTYLSPMISSIVVQACLGEREPVRELTNRERQVLQLVAQGRSTKEAARELGIGARTAESHRNRVLQKLGIHDTAGLVRYAIRCGLIHA